MLVVKSVEEGNNRRGDSGKRRISVMSELLPDLNTDPLTSVTTRASHAVYISLVKFCVERLQRHGQGNGCGRAGEMADMGTSNNAKNGNTLQVLQRLLLIGQLYTSGVLGLLDFFGVLFLLITHGSFFKNWPLDSIVSICAVMDAASGEGFLPHQPLPFLQQRRLLRTINPLMLQLMKAAGVDTVLQLLRSCLPLVQDCCSTATLLPPPSLSIRVPSSVGALCLDLDDTVFLHRCMPEARYLFHLLARSSLTSLPLLQEVVLQAVPHREFLLQLLHSCQQQGKQVFITSFGEHSWVRPLVDIIFGGSIPQANVFCLGAQDVKELSKLNKNRWLVEVQRRTGLPRASVVLVDDLNLNVERAAQAGFSVLPVEPTEGLHMFNWGRWCARRCAPRFPPHIPQAGGARDCDSS